MIWLVMASRWCLVWPIFLHQWNETLGSLPVCLWRLLWEWSLRLAGQRAKLIIMLKKMMMMMMLLTSNNLLHVLTLISKLSLKVSVLFSTLWWRNWRSQKLKTLKLFLGIWNRLPKKIPGVVPKALWRHGWHVWEIMKSPDALRRSLHLILWLDVQSYLAAMAFLWKTDGSEQRIGKGGSEGGVESRTEKNCAEEIAWWQFRGNSKGNEFEDI